MVDFKVANAYSPMLFTADGYELVVMPMMTNEASEAMKRDKAEAEPTTTEQAEPEAEAVSDEPTEAEPEADKPKRSRKREKVAVA
jgi:outer membrane biosynthesis protein TonB